ncbi:hypothetical protein ACIBTS_49015, partial [Streptomyces sp. NPDC050121]
RVVLHRHRRSSRFLRIKQIQYQRVHHSGGGSGVIKRLPHGEFVEVHEPLTQEQLHILTAHEQDKPLTVAQAGSLNGTPTRVQRLRAKLSRSFYGDEAQIPKPTVQEYKEITSSHRS